MPTAAAVCGDSQRKIVTSWAPGQVREATATPTLLTTGSTTSNVQLSGQSKPLKVTLCKSKKQLDGEMISTTFTLENGLKWLSLPEFHRPTCRRQGSSMHLSGQSARKHWVRTQQKLAKPSFFASRWILHCEQNKEGSQSTALSSGALFVAKGGLSKYTSYDSVSKKCAQKGQIVKRWDGGSSVTEDLFKQFGVLNAATSQCVHMRAVQFLTFRPVECARPS